MQHSIRTSQHTAYLHVCQHMYMNGVLCVPSEMIIPTEASPTSASLVAVAELTYAQFMQYIQKDTMYIIHAE